MGKKHKHSKKPKSYTSGEVKIAEPAKTETASGNVYQAFEDHIEKNKIKEEKSIPSTALVLKEKAPIVATAVEEVLRAKSDENKPEVEPEAKKKVEEKDSKSAVFSKIYTSEFKSEMARSERPSFWQSFAQAITSDVLWQSVAVGLVLGAFLFYFNGLQPLILDRYINQSQATLSDLQNRYTDQTNNYNFTQTKIFADIKPFDQNETCAVSQKTDFQNEDFQALDLAQRQVLPDNTLTELPRYNIFYSSEIEKIYSQTYTDYENNLSKYNDAIRNLRQTLSFLNFRSSWIEACSQLDKTDGISLKIQPICKDILEKTKDFQALQLTKFNEALETLDTSAKRCQEVVEFEDKNPKDKGFYPNYGKWQLDWLKGFEKLMAYPIDLSSTDKDLLEINTKFSKTIQDASTQMQDYLAQKDSLSGKLYVLDFKI